MYLLKQNGDGIKKTKTKQKTYEQKFKKLRGIAATVTVENTPLKKPADCNPRLSLYS